MKMMIITAVHAFEEDIKSILKQSQVETFSYVPVTGYKGATKDQMGSNWFAGARHEQDSELFFAFVQEEFVDQVFDAVKTFNDKQESESKIHVSTINLERWN